MSIALDVNPLVYATNAGSRFHDVAADALADLYRRGEPTYLFWPVAVGYVRVSTTPLVNTSPFSTEQALDNVRRLMGFPHVHSGIESPDFLRLFAEACTEVRATGNLVSDAYIAALMRHHGVRRILTHDRDFRKFDGIRVVDPFI